VSLTLSVLRAARVCVLLASGSGKAGPLGAMLAGADPTLPVAMLDRARLTVIADAAALGRAG
jgi:6-phosphogluconolactonase/glucosamine-6-phosphate isomerase/deaminase